VNRLFHTAVLRIPSINPLEGDLKEGDFQKRAAISTTSMPTRGRADRHTASDLYANGPVMTHLDQRRYGGFLVLKKDNNEPLKEALALWQVEFGYVLQFASAIRLQARFVQSLIVRAMPNLEKVRVPSVGPRACTDAN